MSRNDFTTEAQRHRMPYVLMNFSFVASSVTLGLREEKVLRASYSRTASSSFSFFHFADARRNSTMMGCGLPGFEESCG